MRRAKTPSRQLNSEAIRGATLCYMSPVIAGQCSIISAKCVCNVKERDLQRSWNSICKKRDICDKAISGLFSQDIYLRSLFIKVTLPRKKKNCSIFTAIPNTAFFFSAISTQEKKKGSINEESEDSEEEHDQSPVPSTFSQQSWARRKSNVDQQIAVACDYLLACTNHP